MKKLGQKWIACMTVLALVLTLLSSCGENSGDTASVRIMAGTAVSRLNAGESLDIPVDELFQRFIRMLTDENATLTIHTPKTRENPALAVDSDTEVRSALSDILQYAAYTAAKKVEAYPQETEDRLVFSAPKGDGGTFSGWLTKRRDEEKGSQTVLYIFEDQVCLGEYVYAGTIYGSVLRLLETQYISSNVQLRGQYAILRSKYNLAAIEEERGFTAGEFIQTKSGLLWYFTVGKEQPATSIVECFRGAGSRSAYTFSLNEPILRLEPYTKEDGYDYRVVTSTGIRYGSSGTSSKEKIWRLPAAVKLMTVSEEIQGSFDVLEGKIVYAAQDGIYTANSDGSAQRLIASHSVLKGMLDPQNSTGYNYYFNDPRFIMEGSAVSIAVQSSGSGKEIIGFATVQLDSLAIQYHFGFGASSRENVRYVSENLLVAVSDKSAGLWDFELNTQGSLPLGGSSGSKYYTVNGKMFVVSEPSEVDDKGKPLSQTYLAEAESVNNGGELLLSAKGDSFTPHTATENYFVGFMRDSRGLFPVAAYYKNVQPASEAAAAEEILPDISVVPEDPDIMVEPIVDLEDITVEPIGPVQPNSSYPSIAGDWLWPMVEEGIITPEMQALMDAASASSTAATSSTSSVYNPQAALPMDQRELDKMPTMPDPILSSGTSSVGGVRFKGETAAALAQLQQLQQLQSLNDMFGSSSSTSMGFDTKLWLDSISSSSATSSYDSTAWLKTYYEALQAQDFG